MDGQKMRISTLPSIYNGRPVLFARPPVMQIIYAAAAVLITVAAVLNMITGPTGVIIGVATLVPGNVFWRLACEGTTVFFRMHDLLASIHDSMGMGEKDLSATSGSASRTMRGATGDASRFSRYRHNGVQDAIVTRGHRAVWR